MEHSHEHGGGDCCHHHSHADAGKQAHSMLATSVHATLHCLTGCIIGEVTGLAIGVHFQLGMWPTMILATLLAFLAGFSLAIPSVMRREGLTFAAALRAVWLGEVISISVMEVVMNATDYMVGGVTASSLSSPLFYLGIAAAIPAGFLAAWPVNYWLLKSEVKKQCH